MNNKRIVVGAVNWDCSLPSDTFFGFHSSRSLSPKHYRISTPYYANIVAEDKIEYKYRTQQEYDRELEYAISAGIEYFAYCWYGSNPSGRENEWQNHLNKLIYARNMHIQSTLREKIKLCAIIGVGAKELELSSADMNELSKCMQQPYYQTIDGRPLVYVFDGYKQDTATMLRNVCIKNGFTEPYIVYMCNEIDAIKNNGTVESAICAYSFPHSAATYNEFITNLVDDLDKRNKTGANIIPQFSLGWNPSPRIETPVPWVSYENKEYLKQITGEELEAGAKIFNEYIASHPEYDATGHILIFAWNEFEEGAYACPTYNAGGDGINTQRVEALSRITKLWTTETDTF